MAVLLGYRRRRWGFGVGMGVAGMLGWQSWRVVVRNSTWGMPADEARVVGVVMRAREDWVEAPNDLARVGMRKARAVAICEADPGLLADGWVGRVARVAPDGFPDYAGKRTVTVQLALTDDVQVSTPSAPVLNLPEDMVEAGSAVYAAVAGVKVGQRVRFSGRFFGGGDCFEEESLTAGGGMMTPVFEVRLTGLGPG